MARPDEDLDSILGGVDDSDETRADREIQRLRIKLAESERRRLALIRELEMADDRIEFWQDTAPGAVHQIAPRPYSKHEAAALIVASDWHWEETVDPATVNGRNEYNLEIAAQRSETFWVKARRRIEINRSGVKIQRVVLALLGDMMTGYIHEELEESNALSPTQTVLALQSVLIAGIQHLLEDDGIEIVDVVCTHGNHGRTTKRRRISTGYKNSYEWLMYKQLELYFRDNERVRFHVATGSHVYLDILGTVVRFHHGDDVRYQGGVGGLSIPLRKAVDSWDHFQDADLTVIGHWHQHVDFGFAFVNGSLIGYGPYALSIKARYEPPMQGFLIIDAERGKTVVSPIFVEDAHGKGKAKKLP